MLSQARVIAKGDRIRDIARLVRQYGGRASDWVKKSSPEFELDGKRGQVRMLLDNLAGDALVAGRTAGNFRIQATRSPESGVVRAP